MKRYLQKSGLTIEALQEEGTDLDELSESLEEIPECCWFADCGRDPSYSPEMDIPSQVSDEHKQDEKSKAPKDVQKPSA